MGATGEGTRRCELCGRVRHLTFHHLIPRANHRNKWFRKRFDREDMRRRGAWLCRPCHDKVHQLYDAKTLGREFNNVQRLREDPDIARFVSWVRMRS